MRGLTILDEYCQNGLKYDNLKTENLPYKPLYFSPGSKRFEPDSKYSYLMGTISAFSCLNLGHYILYDTPCMTKVVENHLLRLRI